MWQWWRKKYKTQASFWPSDHLGSKRGGVLWVSQYIIRNMWCCDAYLCFSLCCHWRNFPRKDMHGSDLLQQNHGNYEVIMVQVRGEHRRLWISMIFMCLGKGRIIHLRINFNTPDTNHQSCVSGCNYVSYHIQISPQLGTWIFYKNDPPSAS